MGPLGAPMIRETPFTLLPTMILYAIMHVQFYVHETCTCSWDELKKKG